MLVEYKWETHVLYAPSFSVMKIPVIWCPQKKRANCKWAVQPHSKSFYLVWILNCSLIAKPHGRQPVFSTHAIVVMFGKKWIFLEIWPYDCSLKGTFLRVCWVLSRQAGLSCEIRRKFIKSNVLATAKLSQQTCVCFFKDATWDVWSSCWWWWWLGGAMQTLGSLLPTLTSQLQGKPRTSRFILQ